MVAIEEVYIRSSVCTSIQALPKSTYHGNDPYSPIDPQHDRVSLDVKVHFVIGDIHDHHLQFIAHGNFPFTAVKHFFSL